MDKYRVYIYNKDKSPIMPIESYTESTDLETVIEAAKSLVGRYKGGLLIVKVNDDDTETPLWEEIEPESLSSEGFYRVTNLNEEDEDYATLRYSSLENARNLIRYVGSDRYKVEYVEKDERTPHKYRCVKGDCYAEDEILVEADNINEFKEKMTDFCRTNPQDFKISIFVTLPEAPNCEAMIPLYRESCMAYDHLLRFSRWEGDDDSRDRFYEEMKSDRPCYFVFGNITESSTDSFDMDHHFHEVVHFSSLLEARMHVIKYMDKMIKYQKEHWDYDIAESYFRTDMYDFKDQTDEFYVFKPYDFSNNHT